MKATDAPPAGWYPDPEGGVRLRWWDGQDWGDRYRSRPSGAEQVLAEAAEAARQADVARTGPESGGYVPRPALDSQELIAQVRQAARAEIDRAADIFAAQARAATRRIEPLISQYTNRFLRWLKILIVVVVLLVMAWFVFEAVASVTFFDWLGDRIDRVFSDP